jgi:hypothetical protein
MSLSCRILALHGSAAEEHCRQHSAWPSTRFSLPSGDLVSGPLGIGPGGPNRRRYYVPAISKQRAHHSSARATEAGAARQLVDQGTDRRPARATRDSQRHPRCLGPNRRSGQEGVRRGRGNGRRDNGIDKEAQLGPSAAAIAADRIGKAEAANAEQFAKNGSAVIALNARQTRAMKLLNKQLARGVDYQKLDPSTGQFVLEQFGGLIGAGAQILQQRLDDLNATAEKAETSAKRMADEAQRRKLLRSWPRDTSFCGLVRSAATRRSRRRYC